MERGVAFEQPSASTALAWRERLVPFFRRAAVVIETTQLGFTIHG